MRSTGSIQRTWRICTTWMSLKWKRGRKGWKGWKGRYLKPQTKPTAKLRPQQWSLKRSKRPGLYGWSKIHAVSILQSAEIDLTMWWLCDDYVTYQPTSVPWTLRTCPKSPKRLHGRTRDGTCVSEDVLPQLLHQLQGCEQVRVLASTSKYSTHTILNP